MFLDCYIMISVFIALIDVALAVKCFQENKTTGRYLGYACLGAAVVDVSYLISILNDDYMYMSIMSSIYFVTIDMMLLSLLVFTVYFTKRKFTNKGKLLLGFCIGYIIIEIIVFGINPFHEIAIHYIRRETVIAKYSYQMKPLFWMHLVFSYWLVGAVLYLLVQKMCKIPKEYRTQYSYVILGILAIVAVNGFFLFYPNVGIYNFLDYSICGYSLTAFLLYWSCFNYSTHGMMNYLKNSIFENIGQGIVLFDYHDKLILRNERADYFLGRDQLDQCIMLEDFLNCYNLSLNFETNNEKFSLQCYIKHNGEVRPLRYDVCKLKNKDGQRLGLLFVFSDAVLETDVLTGFQQWESFQLLAREKQKMFSSPMAVAVCDINSLSVINSTRGLNTGDQLIKHLADTMRSCFPKQTYYVRGTEATLIALCSQNSETEMNHYLALVKERFPCKIQCAVSAFTENDPDILQAVHVAIKAMRTKKLLDHESIHSEMLSSLIRALQECDSDTEHHVRRTQSMGAELGKRIALTDVQQSHLSLLCLLHDIGKIGIPLEILNKPGKLSAEEWETLKSHTEKGYEIANSNSELKDIADEIRHHHERWDGTGYPDGLSRESIPLLSRVIAVVDAYDAMTNNRSYRSAMSVPKALAELKRCAGSQFDPYIVSEFLRMMKETSHDGAINTDLLGDTEFCCTTAPFSSAVSPSGSSEKVTHVHLVPYSRYVLDESMRIVSVDKSFEKLTGYTQEDIQQNIILQSDLIPEEDRTEYLCQTNACLAKNPVLFQEHKICRKDGAELYVLCYGRIYYDSAVRAERSEIILVDITDTYSMKRMAEAEQNKAQNRLRYWESTYRRDSLTGLLNHAAFRNDVELKLLEGKTKIMMLMVDVDKFKEYNDTFGHQNGDKFLVFVANTLLVSLRKEDRACRMGGDEFAAALFFDSDTAEKQMRERAQQIFDKMNVTLQSAKEGTGISMGVVIAKQDTTFSQLYEQADDALYQAKKNGRGRAVIL